MKPDTFTLYYNFENTKTDDYTNSISAGHFSKKLMSRRLVSADGGGLGCLLGAKCFSGSLEITYDKKFRILTIEEFRDGKLANSCEF